MQLKLRPKDTIDIRGESYSVLPHPALPRMAYKQTGGRGSVYKLSLAQSKNDFALKVFTLSYQTPQVLKSAEALASLKNLPGLDVANRQVLQPDKDEEIIQKWPPLKYAVLMPWIQGKTWYEIITKPEQPFTLENSKQVAYQLMSILTNLEQQGLAHGDIAGGNVVIDLASDKVTLIDIEEMYGAEMPKPTTLPAGQAGYQHKTSATTGNWNACGDRFAGAILLAEILVWHDEALRNLSSKEYFFEQGELQSSSCLKFKSVYQTLFQVYSPEVAALFKIAWESPTLADCPDMTAWKEAFEASSQVVSARRPLSLQSPGIQRRPINKPPEKRILKKRPLHRKR